MGATRCSHAAKRENVISLSNMNTKTIIITSFLLGLSVSLLFSVIHTPVATKNLAPATLMTPSLNQQSLEHAWLSSNTQAGNMNKPLTAVFSTTYLTSRLASSTGVELMAWIYPYAPACAAALEYKDGRKIDILKPEFFTINEGELLLLDETAVSCNGYSPAFVAELKKYSAKQFATISSASAEDMATFIDQALREGTDINTLVSFVVSNNLTGIELNFEDFGNWTPEYYTDFKTFVTRLGNALHANNKELMVVGPPIANEVEEGWFVWRYEDFTPLPIDRMVVMGYDYQYDHGAGQPITPLRWLSDVIVWISARYPADKLTMGLPSYGYEGLSETHQFSILTRDQIRSRPGYNTATRDPYSAEMTWQDGDKTYFYQDSISLATKQELLTRLGIRSVSIWHLGGNPWFSTF